VLALVSELSTADDDILANPGRGAGEALLGVDTDEPPRTGLSIVFVAATGAGRVMNPVESTTPCDFLFASPFGFASLGKRLSVKELCGSRYCSDRCSA
jgi:hypothetical protein